MKDLAQRISSIEEGKQFDVDKDAIRELKIEMLTKLRALREAFKGDADLNTSSKEVDRLRLENEELRKKLERNEYRINHLVDSLASVRDGEN